MTVSDAARYAAQKLGGITEDAAFEARELTAFALGISKKELPFSRSLEIGEDALKTLDSLLERRLGREPLQYILGEWSFYGLPFITRPGALIPRQDTETLVEQALLFLKGKPASEVLDLCCGTGCIGVTIAKLSGAKTVFSDISGECVALAKENAALNGVAGSFVCADLFSGVEGLRFDLICVNPPYLTAGEMRELQPEVCYEPENALFGGESGLDFYRRISNLYTRFLNEGGALLMEIGCGQGEAVGNMFPGSRLIRDVNGKDRVVQVVI